MAGLGNSCLKTQAQNSQHGKPNIMLPRQRTERRYQHSNNTRRTTVSLLSDIGRIKGMHSLHQAKSVRKLQFDQEEIKDHGNHTLPQ